MIPKPIESIKYKWEEFRTRIFYEGSLWGR